MSEKTTSEVARDIGITPKLLNNWKRRNLLKLAPPGVPGQGRSVECLWSEEAFCEAKALSENQDRKKFCRPTPPQDRAPGADQ